MLVNQLTGPKLQELTVIAVPSDFAVWFLRLPEFDSVYPDLQCGKQIEYIDSPRSNLLTPHHLRSDSV